MSQERRPSPLDYEAIVKLSDGFNGADMRNVCTEAGKHSVCVSLTRMPFLLRLLRYVCHSC